jgi:hypothetical protein
MSKLTSSNASEDFRRMIRDSFRAKQDGFRPAATHTKESWYPKEFGGGGSDLDQRGPAVRRKVGKPGSVVDEEFA